MKTYYRPIPMTDPARPRKALSLAGGWCWFDRVERMTRDEGEVIPADDAPANVLERLTAARTPLAGIGWEAPRMMGILNVTPDSFSDGGKFLDVEAALGQARRLRDEGADIIDIGGESTRPGAAEVAVPEENSRTEPVIGILANEIDIPISIDTRKSVVAKAALQAGATLLNDVAAMEYDPCMAALAAQSGAPICLMHNVGDPATMQNDPHYDDVLFDVYDYLEARVAAAEEAGIARGKVILDPGIGFGKTLEHNLQLLRHLSLFHSLGCVLLLGASRKRFIGTISNAPEAQDRMPGSVAVALAGALQGVQIFRVHDMKATRQALSLQAAVTGERWIA
ncbi:dihydropteroate synthase [Pseudoruegeria sp. HB172150]|uniref:dihydropteroate synthase n=1 Tax=Pseudoruegeria sp. HB172150 TaxID=2721164 RepID=UPI001551EEF6|nr:dihydropteroate synthase [Pseudoruegeria sp. HB172150]